MQTFFNTPSAAPYCVSASFLRRANLRLAFVYRCMLFKFAVLKGLHKDTLHYLYVEFCVIQSDFNRLYFVRQCKNVVNVLFRLNFVHQSFDQFESTLIAV